MKKTAFILVLVVVAIAIMCEWGSAQRYALLQGRIKTLGVTPALVGVGYSIHIIEDVKENVVCYVMDNDGRSMNGGISCVRKKAE